MKRLLFISLFLLVFAFSGKAQLVQFKALYIYNIAKYIGWPDYDSTNDLIITVIGDNQTACELQKLAEMRKVGLRKVVVKQAGTVAAATHSHMIYIAETKATQIPAACAKFSEETIIISAMKGQCSSGAMISFVNADGKLSYEISSKNIAKSGLTVSRKLYDLGKEVN